MITIELLVSLLLLCYKVLDGLLLSKINGLAYVVDHVMNIGIIELTRLYWTNPEEARFDQQ